MSDEPDTNPEFEKWKQDVEKLKPLMQRVGELAVDESKQIAADLGDPQTETNRMFWATLFNVVSGTQNKVNSGSQELRIILDLSRTITPRQRNEWAACKRVVETCFDEMDAGEALGLGDACFDLKPDDSEADRAKMLHECAEFYCVPAAYRPAIAEVMAMIMKHVADKDTDTRWNLPQHWACMYSYVAGALAARANPDETDVETIVTKPPYPGRR